MYCATRSPRVTCTLNILGLPGPRSSTSWMPASTFSVSGVTPCGWPLTSTATPCGFDSMTSVPVLENSHSGAGTYCAAVKAHGHRQNQRRRPQKFPEPAAHRPRGVGGRCACQ